MHEAVYWVGFIGAWLLFVGPVYQSALELREEEDARVSMQKVLESAPPPERVSPWWWLLPPVAIVKLFRRRGQYMGVIDELMSQGDRESIDHYKAVAKGWWYVGAGAWFIFLEGGVGAGGAPGVDGQGLLAHRGVHDDGGPRRRRRGR